VVLYSRIDSRIKEIEEEIEKGFGKEIEEEIE
jgi:hypothetical protein